jgi:fibronectin type 3 domain-containing protein
MDSDLKIFYHDNRNEYITGTFKILDDRTYSFYISNHDQQRTIVIDPLLYSTYVGGRYDEKVWDMAVDDSGLAYLTGSTSSPDFPLSAGAYNKSINGLNEIFVFKLDPETSVMSYSTFIGGSYTEMGYGIALTGNGEAVITGQTSSTDFPVTPNAYSKTHKGNYYPLDVIVFKLDSSGSNLLYSTFIGGNSNEVGYDISLDSSGNAYLTGYTESTDFPTKNGYENDYFGGDADVFIVKLNPTGSAIVFSTYLGGNDEDVSYDILIDQQRNVYILGETQSSNFPTSIGAYDSVHSGYYDVFVTKLNYTGLELNFSTFVGGSSWDYGDGFVLDSNGDIYVTGFTRSTNFPITSNAYDNTYELNYDAFVFKLNSSGTELLYSSFIGGNNWDLSRGIDIDSENNVYIVGNTTSSNFPTTSGAYDDEQNGIGDVFLVKMDSTCSSLMYSTYIGGSKQDWGHYIYIDSEKTAYVASYSESNNFPTTLGAYDTDFDGFRDAYILKFNFSSAPSPPSAPGNLKIYTYDDHLNLTWNRPMSDGGSPIYGYNLYRGYSSNTLSLFKYVGYEFKYSDTDVIKGLRYHYRVSALNAVGESSYSLEVNSSIMTLPTPPQDITATSGDNFVNLCWLPPVSDGGSTIIEFRIYRGSNINYVPLYQTVNGDQFSFNDTNAHNGVLYYYYLTTLNDLGESQKSDLLIGRPLGSPDPPRNIYVLPSDKLVQLFWSEPYTDGGSDILEYRVYRANESNNPTYIASVDNTTLEYNDSAVINGIRYSYYLLAVNSKGVSGPSDVVIAIPYSYPSPPLNLTAYAGKGFINISWEPPLDNGGFEIRRYKGYTDDDWSLVKLDFQTSNLWFNKTNAIPGKTYNFLISAETEMGEGELSEPVSAKIYSFPMPPDSLTVTKGSGYLDLSWDEPENDGGYPIERYKIYRGTRTDEMEFLNSASPWITSYRDTSVEPDKKYYYYIIAITDFGESGPSNIAGGMAEKKLTKSSPPINLTAEAGIGYINLSWESPKEKGGSEIIKYIIYRGVRQDYEIEILRMNSDVTSYQDRSVTSGITYFYYITAQNSIGYSDPSNTVNAEPEKEGLKINVNREPSNDNLILALLWVTMILIIVIILIFLRLRLRTSASGKDKLEQSPSGQIGRVNQGYDNQYQPDGDNIYEPIEKKLDGPERLS